MCMPINYVIILNHMIISICIYKNKDFIEEFDSDHEFRLDLDTLAIVILYSTAI